MAFIMIPVAYLPFVSSVPIPSPDCGDSWHLNSKFRTTSSLFPLYVFMWSFTCHTRLPLFVAQVLALLLSSMRSCCSILPISFHLHSFPSLIICSMSLFLTYGRCARSTCGSQNRAVVPKRHEKSIFVRS